MPTYVIGDVQGCFDELMVLLDKIKFNRQQDKVWFTGDLVNRGPKSLEVLRFVSGLPHAKSVLGNHDLTLLVLAYTDVLIKEHNMSAILSAPDKEELLQWLRHQPLFYYDAKFNTVLVHAGIPPQWTLSNAKQYAKEVETELQSNRFRELLVNMFGNEPSRWDAQLTGWDRLRFIINAFTRLRFCNQNGELNFSDKGDFASSNLVPWFKFPWNDDSKILFGHWAAIKGSTGVSHAIALDTGCFWGGCLTALRLEDNKKFIVGCKDDLYKTVL